MILALSMHRQQLNHIHTNITALIRRDPYIIKWFCFDNELLCMFYIINSAGTYFNIACTHTDHFSEHIMNNYDYNAGLQETICCTRYKEKFGQAGEHILWSRLAISSLW